MSDKRAVKFLEVTQLHGEPVPAGDVRTLDKPIADAFIKAGVCECSESGEKNERVAGATAVIEPDNIVQTVS